MLRALLLDDEPLVLDTLTLCLRAPGIHLTTCREIEAAEVLLASFHFDLLVTDLSLSRLGGLEGMRLVRFVTTHFPDTLVFILSGHVDNEVRALAAVLGAARVLEKPAGLTELRQLLLERRDVVLKGAPPGTDEGPLEQVGLLEDFLNAGVVHSLLQPVMRLAAGQEPPTFFGVECLARGPQSTLLGDPSIFLGYAAKKELLFEADMICVRSALDEVRQLGRSVSAFVNVQPRSMTNPEFTARLMRELEAAELAPTSIILELTEQQTIMNPRAFAATLGSLRDRGLRVALDDFGEGYSNLNLFQDLRPDFVKISGTFCRHLAHDELRQIIVRSTAEMCRRAGSNTVMEAVETAEDAALLYDLGIEYAQGFFYSRPLPGAELALTLAARP